MIKTFFILYGRDCPNDQFRVGDFPFPLRVDDSVRSDVITNCDYTTEDMKDSVAGRGMLVSTVEYGVDEGGSHYQFVGLNVVD